MLFTVGLCVGSAHANLVQNGGFETTTVTTSTTLPTDMTFATTILPGWANYSNPQGILFEESYTVLYLPGQATTIGAPCIATRCNAHPTRLWAVTESSDRGNFMAMDGDVTIASTLSQMITGLTVGATYELTFEYAGAQIDSVGGDTTNALRVGFGDDVQMTQALANVSRGFTGWMTTDMQFTATATSQLLSFFAVGTPAGLPPTTLLDNISLTEVSAVPEPGSIALMGAALGALGLMRRRKPLAA